MIIKRKINTTKLNLFLDLAIALAFVVELEEHFTGLHIHELLGLAFGTALIVHIVLHWRWIVSITRQFFKRLFHESRLNYVLNLAVFIDLLTTAVTGVLISRTLGLGITLDTATRMTAQQLHIFASQLTLILVGLHVAMHWKWIATHAMKYLFTINLRGRKAQPAQPAAVRPLTRVEAH